MLSEERRKQLDGIVQQMTTNKEPDTNIQAVVDDFKNKYSSEQPQVQTPDRYLKKAADITNTIFGGGKIGEALAGGQVSGRELAGSALQSASLFFPAAKVAGVGAQAARYLGMRGLSKAVGAIGSGALGGYGFDVATNLQDTTKQGAEVLSPDIGTAIGGGIPAAGAIAGTLAKKGIDVARTVAPKLLSYTADIPEQAFDALIQRREAVTQAIKEGGTAEQALKTTRGAVRQLRSTLSQEWDDGVKQIADEFNGVRVGVSGNLENKIETLADEFGVRIPQNIKSASIAEWMDTLKSINELPKLMLSVSPKGAIAREAKKELKDLIIKEFGGEKGSVATLYQNYAAKKTVFDAANQLVQAYSSGKPIQESTALGRLKALFNDNKSAYLDAILQLEKETGQDLLSRITALQFQSKLPKTGTVLSASGGLKSSKGPLDKAVDMLLIPLTSPRAASWIINALENIKIKTPNITTPGDELLNKIDEATKNIPNKQGGFIKLPTVDISKNITPESVASKVDAQDIATIKSFLDNPQDTNAFLKAQPILEGMKIDKADPKVQTRFLKEVLDLADQTSADTALIQEAKKYKTAEEFWKNNIGNEVIIPNEGTGIIDELVDGNVWIDFGDRKVSAQTESLLNNLKSIDGVKIINNQHKINAAKELVDQKQKALDLVEENTRKNMSLFGIENQVSPLKAGQLRTQLVNKKIKTQNGVVSIRDWMMDKMLKDNLVLSENGNLLVKNKNEHVGIGLKTEAEKEFAKYIDSNRSELTDIWKKANGEADDLLTQAKGKTLEEFVRAQGTPVYHGTKHSFDVFEDKYLGQVTGSKSAKEGFYFTTNRNVAEGYANFGDSAKADALKREADKLEEIAKRTNKSADWDAYNDAYLKYEDEALTPSDYSDRRVIEARLDMKNPLIVDFDNKRFIDEDYMKLLETAKKNGNDGVIIKNVSDAVETTYSLEYEPDASLIGDIYVPFSAKQIKTRSQLTDIWKKANKK